MNNISLKKTNGKVTIYTVRISRLYGYGCARPCKVCVRWMKIYNVSKVVYSENGGKIRIAKLKDILKEEPHLTKTQRQGIFKQ